VHWQQRPPNAQQHLTASHRSQGLCAQHGALEAHLRRALRTASPSVAQPSALQCLTALKLPATPGAPSTAPSRHKAGGGSPFVAALAEEVARLTAAAAEELRRLWEGVLRVVALLPATWRDLQKLRDVDLPYFSALCDQVGAGSRVAGGSVAGGVGG